MTRFSILVPTRNRLELLGYAIETVRKQDFQDWEIIVSDNASEQDVRSYVESLRDDRITFLRTEAFVSVTENWNRALEKSVGDYVIMLGDDDGLFKGSLKELNRLIRDFSNPDFVYTDAVQFAYPNVFPHEPKGFFLWGYAPFFSARDSTPFWLRQTEAKELVRVSCDMRLACMYNMQHIVISRGMVKALSEYGRFFQSPYPDYYATNALFLKARRILMNPVPLTIIGISPKSFGYFYVNRKEGEGNSFLNNPLEPDIRNRLSDVLLPGSALYTSWLAAMETLKKNFGSVERISVNYRRYRMIQILAAHEAGDETIASVLPHLTVLERMAYRVFRAGMGFLQNILDGPEWVELCRSLHRYWDPNPEYDSFKTICSHRTILELFEHERFSAPEMYRERKRESVENRQNPIRVGLLFQRAVRYLDNILRGESRVNIVEPKNWETVSGVTRVKVRVNGKFLPHLEGRIFSSKNPDDCLKCFSLVRTQSRHDLIGIPVGGLPEGAYVIRIYDKQANQDRAMVGVHVVFS